MQIRLPFELHTKFALLSFFALTLTSCGGGSGVSNVEPLVGNKPSANCPALPDQGELADNTNLQKNLTTSLVFGQKWNDAWAQAVGKTNKVETVRFLGLQGVRVVRAPSDGCQTFPFLQYATGNDFKIWQQALGEVSGGTLLGLYPGREYIKNGQVVSADYVLILRGDTDRYTLLHEMGHYLLHRYRLESGLGNADFGRLLDTKSEEVKTAWETNQNFPSPSAAVRLGQVWTEAMPVFDEDVKRSSLEESAVEEYLSRSFIDKKISHVPKEAALGGWYLIENLKRAREYYKSRKAEAEKILTELKLHTNSALGEEVQFHVASVERAIDLIRQRFLEMDQVEKAALARRLLLKKFTTNSEGKNIPVPINKYEMGCGHVHSDELQTPLF